MDVRELTQRGGSQVLVDVWAEEVDVLTEIQVRAVNAGLLERHGNFLVVAPTSSGKTLVGEMAAVSAAYRSRRQAVFIVPIRAVADEHFAVFRERYRDLLPVVISTGDWSEFDEDIRAGNFGLAVMTYEKLSALLVQQPQLLGRLSAVVVDEVQMLSDGGRGPELEKLLTQLLIHGGPQLVALSASLDELNELDGWLRATLVMSHDRPVPLTEGVLGPRTGRALVLSGGDTREAQLAAAAVDRDAVLVNLCKEYVAEGKQAIVFRTSVPKTRETALRLRQALPAVGLPERTAELLHALELSPAVEDLRSTLASGVGFHNADLTAEERRAVEKSFREGDTRVVVATTTLAMGVNLPTDLVLVADTKRWIPVRGAWAYETITVSEYKNAAGRAGRLGQRTEGTALLLAEQDAERRQLFDFYVRGEVEPVRSRIPDNPFADVVFGILCGGLASDREALSEFIAATFAFQTFYDRGRGGMGEVRRGVEAAVAACIEGGFVGEGADGALTPTTAARILAGMGVPLAAAVQLTRAAATLAVRPLTRAELGFAASSCPNLFESRPYVDWRNGAPIDPRANLAIPVDDLPPDSELKRLMQAPHVDEGEAQVLLRTSCLVDWMTGASEGTIAGRYKGCSASRVRSIGKTASWLLEALAQILAADSTVAVDPIHDAVAEARYGLPSALAGLAKLAVGGIGRQTLMRLYEADGGRELYEPDVFLDAESTDFQGTLTPAEVERIRAAIAADRGEAQRRRRSGQVGRAGLTQLQAQMIDDLYGLGGQQLEQAVVDALTAVGAQATRVVHQPRAEEDVRITHPAGTIVVSVTASRDGVKPISWEKARETLGMGAGLNPLNFVCIGRPDFHVLAIRQTEEIAREVGARRLLLVPIDVLAEAIVQCAEGATDTEAFIDLLATRAGHLRQSDLPERIALS